MDFAGCMSGAAPYLRKFQIGVSITNIGIPFKQAASNVAGIVIGTTTDVDNMVGINLDTATGAYVTAQQTDGTSPERLVTVIINPDAILKVRIAGSATNAALATRDVTTASTDGLSVTTALTDAGAAVDWASPTMDEGTIWGFKGANTGLKRKITSVSSTVATVTVAFDYDTVVGDKFAYAPIHPMETLTVTLTTDLKEIRQDAATATNTAALRCINTICRDIANDGLYKSYGIMVSGNHALGGVLI